MQLNPLKETQLLGHRFIESQRGFWVKTEKKKQMEIKTKSLKAQKWQKKIGNKN